MDKYELLSILQQNATDEGIVQYTYTPNPSVKKIELKVLEELESEGHIYKVTSAIGYAIYQIL